MHRGSWRAGVAVALGTLLLPLLAACGGEDNTLTVYSGRNESLIGPILERFSEDTGTDIEVRYGDTAGLASTLREEGDADDVRADVFIAQDAGALGAVQDAGLFATLDDSLLERVPPALRSDEGQWVGLSGRARVIVYNTEVLSPEDLPDSILDFTDPEWGDGRLGWAPTNGSFQAWVTALRLAEGEEGARAWLEGIQANDPVEFPNNVTIVEAAARGEIDAGFVNHYYLYRYLAEEGEDFEARNYYTAPGDVGTMVNVAGAGILADADAPDEAEQLLDYLLSEEAQAYFAEETHEYPLIDGVAGPPEAPPLSELQTVDIDLSALDDLDGTLDLLRETGVLP